ncbi:MAG: hypothetical protein IKK09_06255 [Clostridia bacterium]|nr:hypothetical protein [Clostridia bacterium]
MGMKNEFRIIYDWLDDLLSEEEKKQMLSHDAEDLSIYNSELIAWVRDNILNEKNELYKFYIESDVTAKEDMATDILEGFYGYLLYKSLE